MEKKVLVVDDDAGVRRAIRRILESIGCRIMEAEDGAQVLEIIERDRPNLVLLDIYMPKVDGMALIEDIVERYPGIAVIVVSGHVEERLVRLAIERGACDFVAKPINCDYLQATVTANLLKKSR
ncbi:MAG: response regulator [Elusimicrobia bacterium]|nr:response regulator [Elusimicrobiota bacterium]